jgi:hypothetical protein
MSFKALRRPHEFGRSTTQVMHSGRGLARARSETGSARPVGRWAVAGDGRLRLSWTAEAERTEHLITRKRGSHV